MAVTKGGKFKDIDGNIIEIEIGADGENVTVNGKKLTKVVDDINTAINKGDFKELTITADSSVDTQKNEPLKVRNNRIDIFKETITDSNGSTNANSFVKIDNSKKQIVVDNNEVTQGKIKLSGMEIVGDRLNGISDINEISAKKLVLKEGASNDERMNYMIEPGMMYIGSYVGIDGVRYPTATLEWCKNGNNSSSQDNRSMEFMDRSVRIAIDETGREFSIEAPNFNLCCEAQNPLIETKSADGSNLKFRSGERGEAGSASSISFKGNNIRICGDIEIFCPDDNCSELPADVTQEEKYFLNGYLLNKLIELRREVRQTTLYRYSATPQKVGEWIDGTPVWRVALKRNFTEAEASSQSVNLQELIPVIDGNTPFVVNYCINVFLGSPGLVDDISCKISANAVSFDLAGTSTGSVDTGDGIYGWIEFVTPESNIITV